MTPSNTIGGPNHLTESLVKGGHENYHFAYITAWPVDQSHDENKTHY